LLLFSYCSQKENSQPTASQQQPGKNAESQMRNTQRWSFLFNTWGLLMALLPELICYYSHVVIFWSKGLVIQEGKPDYQNV
jgi:hypothetical protein